MGEETVGSNEWNFDFSHGLIVKRSRYGRFESLCDSNSREHQQGRYDGMPRSEVHESDPQSRRDRTQCEITPAFDSR